MKTSIKLIGAFALVICMAFAVANIASEDVEATGQPNDLSAKINEYAKAVGFDSIVTASVTTTTTENDTLAVVVNTDKTSMENMHLDLFQPYVKFTNTFTGYNVSIDGLEVIKSGAPTNVMTFAVKLMHEVKEAMIAEKSTAIYSGDIVINSSNYKIKITVNICEDLKNLGHDFFTNGRMVLQPYYDEGGKLDYVDVAVKMDQTLFEIVGKCSSDEFMKLLYKDLVGYLAADGVLGKLVSSSSQRSYIDTVCNEILGAYNFKDFLKDSVRVTDGDAGHIFQAFKSATTEMTGFQGLMDAIKTAMSDITYKVSDSSVLKDDGCTIEFKGINLQLYTEKGAQAQEHFYTVIKTKPTISYGDAPVAVVLDVSSGDSATITPSGKAVPGDTLKLSITPGAGREISSVVYYIDNKPVKSLYTISSQDFTVAFGNGVHKIVVTCEEPAPPSTYSITVTNDGNGTAAASASSAAPNTTITLTATPKEGYIFDAWESNDVVIIDNTFTMPAKNVSIKATFKPIPPEAFSITVTTVGSGTASADKTSAYAGEVINLTQKAGTGYYFVGWDSEEVLISGDSFTMPAENVTVTAMFDLITLYITIEDVDNGYIMGEVEVKYGSDAAFTIVADDDYIVESLVIDGKSEAAAGTYVFSKVTESHTIGATFKYVKGASTEVDGEGNTIETYTEEVAGKDVDVVKESYVDGSSENTATTIDEEAKVESVATIITDKDGNTETQVTSTIDAEGTATVTTTQLEAAQDSAKVAAAALGITELQAVEVVIDTTTTAASSDINVALDITKYDGTSVITFNGDKAGLSFDSASMNGIKKKGNDIQLKLEEVSVLTPEQQKAADGNKVFEITTNAGDAVITTLDGKAYLAIPTELPPGATVDKVSIYFMADDGKVEKIPTKYVDGNAVGELTHFSKYFAAVNYSPAPEPEPSGDGLNAWLIVGIVAVVLIVIAAGAFFWFKRN